jgi:hypothetical protein
MTMTMTIDHSFSVFIASSQARIHGGRSARCAHPLLFVKIFEIDREILKL